MREIILFLAVLLVACSEVKVVDITKNNVVEPVVLEINKTEEAAVQAAKSSDTNVTETEIEERSSGITYKKPEFIILISDDAPISDITWATELAQEIQYVALENKKISKRFSYKSGFSRMYGEISSLNELSGRMSLVIYNGEAVVVIGMHDEEDDGDYQEMADYLKDLTNADRVISSNDVKSKNFKSLF